MMSSMLASLIKNALLLAGVSGLAATSEMSRAQIEWYRTQIETGSSARPPAYIQSDPLGEALVEWKRLQQSDNWSFSEYAQFLLAHPGWPGERSRRAAAETILDSGQNDAGLVIRFFERFPPLTASGHIRYAEALAARGDMNAAADHARAAWRTGRLRASDENAILGRFASALRPEDYEARMDALLWVGSTSAAQRFLSFVAPERQPVMAARLAFRTNAPDAAERAGAVDAAGRNDPGFIADRAAWLRDTAQSPAMRAYLAQPRYLNAVPGNVEKWYEVLLSAARGAANDGQYSIAYRIASQVDDAYPAGTDVSARPYGERDDYTSLTWLAGTTAMRQLGRPQDAVLMFSRYAGGSRTPQTQSKGLYWAGRAAEAANDTATARAFYERAAGFPDLFYGQLALERLGRPLAAPRPIEEQVDRATRDAFFNRETVRAAQLLGQMGNWEDQGLFIRQIAADATSDTDHILAAELSRSIERPDLGVMVGRSAQQNGLSNYSAAGYPSIRVPVNQLDNWTMIHAIARQESQFDRRAVSHAGARGLMQLMPGTARETATRLGLSYDTTSLVADPDYNIQLGSTYFQRMLSYYGGSYPLAVAAYNAGPGNVNRWLRANGDPRTPGVDILDWIENIPIFETKNYVQRVLENAVVYDLMNPERARSHGPTPLSWYLGKNTPG